MVFNMYTNHSIVGVEVTWTTVENENSLVALRLFPESVLILILVNRKNVHRYKSQGRANPFALQLLVISVSKHNNMIRNHKFRVSKSAIYIY